MPNENEIEKLDQQKKAEAEPKVEEPAKVEPQVEPPKVEETPKVEPKKEEEPKVEDKAEPKAEPFRKVDDYMLKEDFEKLFKPYGEKIDALIQKDAKLEADNKALAEEKANLEKQKAELEAKQKEIEAQLNGLKDKYENNPFGNATHTGMVNPSAKGNAYVSFDEMSKPFIK